MNRMAVFALILVSLAWPAHLFTVDIERGGSASATLSIQGDESVLVPLPSDSRDFRIVGGEYSVSDGSATVVPGKSGITTFSFTTSLLTSKSGDSWRASFTPPEDSSIRVFLPEYASFGSSSPLPASVSATGYSARLDFLPSGAISLTYSLGAVPQAGEESSDLGRYILAAAVLLAAAAIIASYLLAGRRPAPAPEQSGPAQGKTDASPSLGMTPGKKAMMETFNGNDLTLVRILLESDGRMRRNELERRSGISKSSLAMALNRLEKRRIVDIDRTSTTHFVRLSGYFLAL